MHTNQMTTLRVAIMFCLPQSMREKGLRVRVAHWMVVRIHLRPL